jgi:hypothetical protein
VCVCVGGCMCGSYLFPSLPPFLRYLLCLCHNEFLHTTS